MLRDNPEGSSSRWLSSAGGPSPALHVNGRKSSDDRPSCLENPSPAGAESTLTENVASPFQAEPRQIKQHLRIKAFYGTSENAVKTQIWIAVSIYVLVAIVRKRLGLETSLYQILQILSVTLFEKTAILRALQACDSDSDLFDIGKQLILFNF